MYVSITPKLYDIVLDVRQKLDTYMEGDYKGLMFVCTALTDREFDDSNLLRAVYRLRNIITDAIVELSNRACKPVSVVGTFYGIAAAFEEDPIARKILMSRMQKTTLQTVDARYRQDLDSAMIVEAIIQRLPQHFLKD